MEFRTFNGVFKGNHVHFLDELTKEEYNTRVAIKIEERVIEKRPKRSDLKKLDLKILFYHANGEIIEKEEIVLKGSNNNTLWIKLHIENINDDPRHKLKKLILKYSFNSRIYSEIHVILNSGYFINDIIEIQMVIEKFIIFCKKNVDEIKKFGFKKEVNNSQFFYSHNDSKYSMIEEIYKIKTFLLETSESVVRKDNIFRDYQVIQYDEHNDPYLIKLIYDFLEQKGHNKEKMTFTTLLRESRDWSYTFQDRLIPEESLGTNIRLIEYILNNFNIEERLKVYLLNIDF